MDRPLFSEMLVDRRRQLGLSIKQASNVLRLKEEVLIAFEEGDFDSIPKSGYAQGMLSSYARYLGLNAKTVVNQFSQDLFEHERGAGSHEARRRNRQTRSSEEGPLYETPQAAVYGRSQQGSRTYVESHGFLPTAGGFAGDMSDFATTSRPRPRYQSRSENDDDSSYDVPSSYSAYPQGRPYTSRVPVSTTLSPLGQSQRQRPASSWGGAAGYGARDQYGSARPARQTSSTYSTRDEVTTRRVMPSQYRDDMRLDNDGSSYQSASSMAGRRSSRNIASTERPNVRRRNSSQTRAQMRGRERNQSNNGGIVGTLGSFFQERSRIAALIILMLFIVLMATLFLSVRSCINAQSGTGRTVSVTTADDETSEETTQEESSETDMTDEEEKKAREEAAAAKAAENESSSEERTIEVTVADGEVTWLEIEYDGFSDVAETVDQYVIRCTQSVKPALIKAVLAEKGSFRVIVFARTRSRADSTCRRLRKAGYAAEAIHSDRSQAQRRRALDKFSSGEVGIITATDVLARGIDVDQVDYVINYDVPEQAEDYIHRIGRTGRAGEKGFAITFVTPETEGAMRDIEKLVKQKIPEMRLESFDMEAAEAEAAEKAITAQSKRDPEVNRVKRDLANRAKKNADKANKQKKQAPRGRAIQQKSRSQSKASAQSSKPIQPGKAVQSSKPSRPGKAAQGGKQASTKKANQPKRHSQSKPSAQPKRDFRPGRAHRAEVQISRSRKRRS